MSSFTHKSERYYGSKHQVHTVSWKGHGEVDGDAIREWCISKFGPPGYRDDLGETIWLDDISENGEIFLCKDEYLTMFLLRWS